MICEKKGLCLLSILFVVGSAAWWDASDDSKNAAPKDGQCFIRDHSWNSVWPSVNNPGFVQVLRVDEDGTMKVAYLKTTIYHMQYADSPFEPDNWQQVTCPPNIIPEVADFEDIFKEENVGKCFGDGERMFKIGEEYKQSIVLEVVDDQHYQLVKYGHGMNNGKWKQAVCPPFEKMTPVTVLKAGTQEAQAVHTADDERHTYVVRLSGAKR